MHGVRVRSGDRRTRRATPHLQAGERLARAPSNIVRHFSLQCLHTYNTSINRLHVAKKICDILPFVSLTWGIRIYTFCFALTFWREEIKHSVAVYIS